MSPCFKGCNSDVGAWQETALHQRLGNRGVLDNCRVRFPASRVVMQFGMRHHEAEDPEEHVCGLYVLADSAYGLRDAIMPPIQPRNNANRQPSEDQSRFNAVLSSQRMSIENVFGQVKNEWPRLQGMNTADPHLASQAAQVAMALHNLIHRYKWENTPRVLHVDGLAASEYVQAIQDMGFPTQQESWISSDTAADKRHK